MSDSSTSMPTKLTKVKNSSFTFTWTIGCFDLNNLISNKRVIEMTSPHFELVHPDGNSVTTWHTEVRIVENYMLQVRLSLEKCPDHYLVKGGGQGLLCNSCIALGPENNPNYYNDRDTGNFTECGDGFTWEKIITAEDLLPAGPLEGHDALQLQVDLTIFGAADSSTNEINEGILARREVSLSTIDFASLLESKILSDVTIQCGSETFSAHKAILAGRSDVFKTMLTSDMAEVQSGVINVTDLAGSTFAVILRYLYTGKVNDQLESDSLLQIIHGAEKYGLEELKKYCFGKLVDSITAENAGALAVAAHLYSAEDNVKEAVQNYIQPNFFQLVKNKEFRQLVEQCNGVFF